MSAQNTKLSPLTGFGVAIAMILSSVQVSASSEFVDVKAKFCQNQYGVYLARFERFKGLRALLNVGAAIVNPFVVIGGELISSNSRNREEQELASLTQMYILMQESQSNTEAKLTDALFEQIRSSRPDLQSSVELKALIREANQKKYFCSPLRERLMETEDLIKDLKAGLLSFENLKQEQYSSIENTKAIQEKNIPILQQTVFSGVPINSLILLQNRLIQNALYADDSTAADQQFAADLFRKTVNTNFKFTEELRLPLPLTQASAQFWQELINEKKNAELVDALYEQHDLLAKKVKENLRRRGLNEYKRDSRAAVAEALVDQKLGQATVLAGYDWPNRHFQLYLVKDIRQVNPDIIRVSFYNPVWPEKDQVLWYRLEDDGFYRTFSEATAHKFSPSASMFWTINLDEL